MFNNRTGKGVCTRFPWVNISMAILLSIAAGHCRQTDHHSTCSRWLLWHYVHLTFFKVHIMYMYVYYIPSSNLLFLWLWGNFGVIPYVEIMEKFRAWKLEPFWQAWKSVQPPMQHCWPISFELCSRAAMSAHTHRATQTKNFKMAHQVTLLE